MTYASTIMADVAADLLDDSFTRWTEAEHLDNINSAERMIVFLLPTAYVINGVYQLVEGTKQSLPDGTASFQTPAAATLPQAIEMVNCFRNMGSDGETPGSAIIRIEKDTMDLMLPGWHSETASATVDHFIFDPRDRNTFYVYPPQPSSSMGWIEAVFSAIPPTITAGAGPSYDVDINLDDIFIEPIKHFMKFTAYAKDAATSEYDANRAVSEWNMFVVLIGRKDMIEKDYTGAMKKYVGVTNTIQK